MKLLIYKHLFIMKKNHFIVFLIVLMAGNTIKAYTEILYWTKNYTSDLQWTKHSDNPQYTWEEVSGKDWDDNENQVRTYQVCRDATTNKSTGDRWIRSPYIATKDAKTVYLDIEFTISKCPGSELLPCYQTFNMFYYEVPDEGSVSSTFPLWEGKAPYKKIDTVAAKSFGGINRETYPFSLEKGRNGIYLAIQDEGACISINSVKVYFYYCKETTIKLTNFPRTVSKNDLIQDIYGTCVNNAEIGTKRPVYRCMDKGEWRIFTGSCHCLSGFHADGDTCLPCKAGTYRSSTNLCLPCPSNSGRSTADRSIKITETCPCRPGYGRSENEDHTVPCTRPPSQPTNLTVLNITSNQVILQWNPSKDDGGRKDLEYKIECSPFRRDGVPNWSKCSEKFEVQDNSTGLIKGLTPYTKYLFNVYAENGVSARLPAAAARKFSPTVEVITSESQPGTIRIIKLKSLSPTSITLDWPLPSKPNGEILGYMVELVAPKESHAVKKVVEAHAVMEGLKPSMLYKFQVRARTSAGYGNYSNVFEFGTSRSESLSSNVTIIIISLSFLSLLVISAVICYLRTGKFLCLKLSPNTKKQANRPRPRPPTDEQINLIVNLPPRNARSDRIYVEYKDPREAIEKLDRIINPEEIKVEELIGCGEFAEVYRAVLHRNGMYEKVAAKRVKEVTGSQEKYNFLQEAATLAQFNDPNVIRLIGVVLSGDCHMIITELMDNKSLDQYLRKRKGDLLLVDLLKMQRGIASGMRYLAEMKYVHRDLAARNILIDSNLCCKVSDFGLSRTLSNDPNATYTAQGGKIAIRWTAPECIRCRSFTSASDVWSFGIVVWEIMSGGEKPYWDMTNEDVYINVQEGLRLPSPMNCPKTVHNMMLDCWAAVPTRRPTFSELVTRLNRFVSGSNSLRDSPSSASVNCPQANTELSNDTPNLSQAIGCGQVQSVQTWLELQKLGNYKEQFEKCGIDSLEKVSNMTLSDLKELGISVSFHIDRLENGIRTLKRHLSTPGSPGRIMRSLSVASTAIVDNDVFAGNEAERIEV